MSKVLKTIFVGFLFISILSVTIIPKLISWIWYGEYEINKDDVSLYTKEIANVVFTIIKFEE